jgi:N-acetylneuraminic acid mutarotase
MPNTPPPSDIDNTLTVNEIPIEGITISKPVVKLTEAGQTVTVRAIPLPRETTATDFTWTIDDQAIATLTPNGAECTVTAKTADRQKDSCRIRVVSGERTATNVIISAVTPVPVWQTKAPMPEPRDYHTAAAWNGKIYVMGGQNSGVKNTNYCYDVATDTWSTKTTLPETMSPSNTSVWNGKIYTLGGVVGGKPGTKSYCYDTESDTWETKADLPAIVYYTNTAAWDGKIYVIGGTGKTTNYCYDIETDTWSTKATLPKFISNGAGAAWDGKIYCPGGNIGGLSQKLNYCYDIETDTWSTKADLPMEIIYHCAARVGGKIYVMGGRSYNLNYDTIYDANYCYDIATDTWSTKTNLPEGLQYHSAAAVDGKIYVMGGYSGGDKNTNYCYTPSSDI